jgi:3-phenylpropionate/trans-cinnamate dioxygenase ferredoxin reductase subunit
VQPTTIIVGAGHAGGETAVQLRKAGYEGRILMIGEEAHPPYERPPLSKDFLAGEVELRRLYLRPPHFYPEQGIELLARREVTAIDPAKRQVTAGDETFSYDALVLATGASLRRIDVPGANLAGLHMIRSIDDTIRLRDQFREGLRLVVVGGGYIGLEVAAIARKKGLQVTVIEAAPRLMARTASPAVSAFFAGLHRSKGVEIRLGEAVTGFEGISRVSAVTTTGGGLYPADLVVVGIGISPNTALAEKAGLAVADGILVDAQCRTSDPAIYALGDAARHENAIYGRSLRLESVQNAMGQARVAAMTIAGQHAVYDEIPWFWSNQFDIRLQIAGVGEGADDHVLRGDFPHPGFSVAALKDGRLVALEAVNAPRDFMAAKKLIVDPRNAKTGIDKEKLADSGLLLKDLLSSD